jgi:hypothetical protein
VEEITFSMNKEDDDDEELGLQGGENYSYSHEIDLEDEKYKMLNRNYSNKKNLQVMTTSTNGNDMFMHCFEGGVLTNDVFALYSVRKDEFINLPLIPRKANQQTPKACINEKEHKLICFFT